jgi:predicted nucleic acid-binding Zn ribbon protein
MTNRRDNSGPQSLSKILPEVLRQCGLDDRLEERSVLLHWRTIVGEDIAAHSQAVDLTDGILVLEADHGAWRQEVTMLLPEIKKKFNALFGPETVTEIRWRHQPNQGRKRYGRK